MRNIFGTILAVAALPAVAETLEPEICIPEGCYLSPDAGCYVPVGEAITFSGMSSGEPDEWSWTFEGGNPAVVFGQEAEVVFEKEGRYDVTLTVSGGASQSRCSLEGGLQAGGTVGVWNIFPDEKNLLASVPLDVSDYGYYAGSNIYGDAFAEKYSKPVMRAEISGVSVYFASTACITEDAAIEVSVCGADMQGMPGEALASVSLPAAELLPYDSGVPTVFEFDNPVAVDDDFFIVVGGIPCSMRGSVADEIAILCSPDRGENGSSTVFSHVDYDGQSYWRKDSDRHLSMAVSPNLTFVGNEGPQGAVGNIVDVPGLSVLGDELCFNAKYSWVMVYDLSGKAVKRILLPSGRVPLSDLPRGVYVIAAESDYSVDTLKFVKR